MEKYTNIVTCLFPYPPRWPSYNTFKESKNKLQVVYPTVYLRHVIHHLLTRTGAVLQVNPFSL